MKIYVFGNKDEKSDSRTIVLAEKIKTPAGVEFVFISPNDDLPADEDLVLMDTVLNIDEIIILKGDSVDKLVLSPRNSVHDFDLGFQLKYLKKIGKIKNITIIGLPAKGKIDEDQLQSILRKLVAQDMQGS